MKDKDSDLEYITSEVRRPRKWYFEKSEERYFSMDDEGVQYGYIAGINLPDPLIIKNSLQERIAKGEETPFGQTDADPITYTLWDHWKKRRIT